MTYDEHGGFFHVSQVALRTEPPPQAKYPAFESTGVRVPGMVISPFVDVGNVVRDRLDDTSILKLLGHKFGGGSYSPVVDARPVRSLSELFDRSSARTEVPSPPHPSTITPIGSANVVAMHAAVQNMAAQHPDAAAKFRELAHALVNALVSKL